MEGGLALWLPLFGRSNPAGFLAPDAAHDSSYNNLLILSHGPGLCCQFCLSSGRRKMSLGLGKGFWGPEGGRLLLCRPANPHGQVPPPLLSAN